MILCQSVGAVWIVIVGGVDTRNLTAIMEILFNLHSEIVGMLKHCSCSHALASNKPPSETYTN